MRLRIDLAYDGTGFRGWATQPGLRTVQAELSDALATSLRLERVNLVCAGRTDAGVHARGQVAHLDLDLEPGIEVEGLARRLNGILSSDVRVRRVTPAPTAFDARFSALWRRYAYRVADSVELVDPLARHVLVWGRPLDLDAMNQAAELLVGHHDFASFCRRRAGATTIRDLQHLRWARDDAGRAVLDVRADAFCHSMVRSLVGCLIAVGDGRRPVEWAQGILEARTRPPSVTVARAHGLTLEEVRYPPDDELRSRAETTRARRDG